jgi:hypothetical protein
MKQSNNVVFANRTPLEPAVTEEADCVAGLLQLDAQPDQEHDHHRQRRHPQQDVVVCHLVKSCPATTRNGRISLAQCHREKSLVHVSLTFQILIASWYAVFRSSFLGILYESSNMHTVHIVVFTILSCVRTKYVLYLQYIQELTCCVIKLRF